MKKILIYVAFILTMSLFAVAWHYFNSAQETDTFTCNLKGQVIRVLDGDSITVLDAKRASHKIRLAGIDAPERQQPYGKAARQFLAKQVFKRPVCVSWQKRDKYKRLVGTVSIAGEDINLKILHAGLGWHYKQYQQEQSASNRIRYANAQDDAESASKGLWRDRQPIPPWQWRHGER